jgi:hypothetical protein
MYVSLEKKKKKIIIKKKKPTKKKGLLRCCELNIKVFSLLRMNFDE